MRQSKSSVFVCGNPGPAVTMPAKKGNPILDIASLESRKFKGSSKIPPVVRSTSRANFRDIDPLGSVKISSQDSASGAFPLAPLRSGSSLALPGETAESFSKNTVRLTAGTLARATGPSPGPPATPHARSRPASSLRAPGDSLPALKGSRSPAPTGMSPRAGGNGSTQSSMRMGSARGLRGGAMPRSQTSTHEELTQRPSPRVRRAMERRQQREREIVSSRESEREKDASLVASSFVAVSNMDAIMGCIHALTGTAESLPQMKTVLAGELSKLLRASSVVIAEVDAEAGTFCLSSHDPRFPLSQGLIGSVARSGQPRMLTDPTADPSFCKECDGAPRASMLVFPIRSGDRTCDVIALYDKKINTAEGSLEYGPFGDEDLACLKLLAPFIVSSFRNTLAISRKQALLDVVLEMAAVLDCGQLYKLICSRASSLFRCSSSRVFLVDAATGELYEAAEEMKLVPQDKKSLISHVVCTGESMVLKYKPPEHPVWNTAVDQPGPAGSPPPSNMAVWPIFNTKSMMGALALYDVHGGFTIETEDLIRSFVQHACEAIQNAGAMSKTVSGFQAARSTQNKYAALLEVAQSLGRHLESGRIVEMILQRARELVNAERSSLFLIDHATGELVSQVAEGTDSGIRCPLGQGIIGHAAATGEVLNIVDAYADKRFNVEVDRATGYHTRNILCVPIKNSDDEIVGVTEIMNKMPSGAPFSEEDAELLKAFSLFCGLALHNARLYEDALSSQKKSKALLDVVMALTSDNEITPLLTTIMTRARELIGADRTALFVLDPKNKELRTQVAEGSGEIVLPNKPSSIAGYVASTGEDLVITDAYRDPRFNPGIDKVTGYQTKSVLAIPILNDKGEVIAVTEMINKRGGSFKDEDAMLVKAFASFCGRSLTDMITTYNASQHVPVHIPLVTVTAEDKSMIQRWNFNVNDVESHEVLIRFVVAMFEDLGLLSNFKVPMPTFLAFVHELSKSYNTVPYHNFAHAVDATQFIYLLLRSSDHLRSMLRPVEIFGLLIASMCHDIDHGGLNNAFQVNAQTPLAMLFQNRSIMETYHCSRSIAILGNENFDILCGLGDEERSLVWNFIIGTILATDMAVHFSVLSEFEQLAKGKSQYSTPGHHKLLGKMLMKCGDVSNVSRPFDLARKWADILLREFFRQGDMEKQKNLPVSPFMDRHHVVMAQMQLGFINSIASPMFDLLASLVPEIKPFTVDVLSGNTCSWANMLSEAPQPATSTELQHRQLHGDR